LHLLFLKLIPSYADLLSIEHVPVIRVTNLAKTIDELKDNGFWVAGTEANNATDHTLSFATNYNSQ
jgi:tRNA G18 (ribose-2'-O)-methylase SpoU